MPQNKSVVRLSTVNGKPAGRRYAKINDAADYAQVNPITIRKLVNDDKIHGYRIGAHLLRVDLNELDALMAGENDGAA